ncbi:DNA-binding transcriptional regulator, MarR family [Gulbenkiania indica]|uniref:DNA-binding transcriptional regulator, MarR family n=1 Tax=Gulbenkiania indica TaxID=375574 RepID=A0A0K6GVB3_9NEIS|nr:MarR family transcriptional regulator [Gulbenkiania indica]CUA82505.1 DNA-binding transcriptional regulator, MarR family [Gulbenkiania indica]
MTDAPLPTTFSGPSESPGFLLWRISNLWQREQRNALQPLGLTHTQFVALAVASWFGQEEPITQARLSQLTRSDPMTISQVVRTLEKMGCFERAPHPEDTRAKVITVSDTGRELAAQAIRIVEATDRAFFEPLGEETASLVQLFQKLLR